MSFSSKVKYNVNIFSSKEMVDEVLLTYIPLNSTRTYNVHNVFIPCYDN